jgi:hypothetical protein
MAQLQDKSTGSGWKCIWDDPNTLIPLLRCHDTYQKKIQQHWIRDDTRRIPQRIHLGNQDIPHQRRNPTGMCHNSSQLLQ